MSALRVRVRTALQERSCSRSCSPQRCSARGDGLQLQPHWYPCRSICPCLSTLHCVAPLFLQSSCTLLLHGVLIRWEQPQQRAPSTSNHHFRKRRIWCILLLKRQRIRMVCEIQVRAHFIHRFEIPEKFPAVGEAGAHVCPSSPTCASFGQWSAGLSCAAGRSALCSSEPTSPQRQLLTALQLG